MKILMVCMGNICRSPMAEGIARDLINQYDVKNTQVDSAGTHDYHVGEAPDRRAQETMAKHGHNISKLRARAFSADDFQSFDQIMVADEHNYARIIALAEDDTQREKVVKMLHYHPHLFDQDVIDPYYGGDDGFERVYQQLYTSLDTYLKAL
ncbi:low molecular weight phosphotyrosine protein phosphatase [Suttonella sp. R2A3]|uniref:low molecular weight protein-tyrosine-phosphatase n=1 Tax=Suttonella sp. R2A3 TaxID=2908648 RepID=UPI001F1F325B|nr:low molecular weight protein-tyrosine-phosphatase [Suttonella sp. R2A3]UJF23928.1 low molecular weight phosphotyrosine protein phosphatase [Suttonella sp. R2A3]